MPASQRVPANTGHLKRSEPKGLRKDHMMLAMHVMMSLIAAATALVWCGMLVAAAGSVVAGS